jgi:PAS domain S-box-containing protein
MCQEVSERYSILIVEDDRITARNIRLLLNDAGYATPLVASCASEAVEGARIIGRTDLALVNVEMQGVLSGMDAAAEIHSRGKVPVVCISSSHDEALLKKMENFDPYGYLVKPFRDIELLVAVDIALRRREMERKLERQASEIEECLRLRNCMYSLARLSEITYDSPDDLFGKIFGILEASYFCSADNSITMSLFEKHYHSMNYRGGPNRLKSDISVRGRKEGVITVHYDGAMRMSGRAATDDDPCVYTSHLDVIASVVGRVVERVESEKVLKETVDLLDSIIRSSPLAMDINAPDGTVLLWNPAAERIFGWASDEVLGKINPTVPPFGVERHLSIIEDTLHDHPHSMLELTRRRLDGSMIDISLSTSSVRNAKGEPIAVMGIISDITERKEMERVHLENERKFRSIFEKSPIGIGLIDENGRLFEVNKALCTMLGYPEDDLKEMSCYEILAIPDVDRKSELREVLHGHRGQSYSLEKNILKRNGESLWAHVIMTIIEGEAGRYLYGLVMMEDVTDRKTAEMDLARSQKELRNLSAHLQDTIEQEKKMIAREIHDTLGQSLFMLKMDMGQMRIRLDGSRSTLTGRMKKMMSQVDEAIRKTRSISALLRPEMLEELGLYAAIELHAREFTKRSGIRCLLDLPETETAIDEALSIALFRIFQEVLVNVLRHARASVVETKIRVDKGKIFMTIRDNGRGITASKINSMRSFGLAGIRERAIACGGAVNIKGLRNKGTEIHVLMPLSAS